ncbi:MAG: Rhodanese-like protein [Verrucomicrobiales bacterium]|nr:Rhodanese-like protein [Verrucomicrobiales bacterium]MDB6130214.1 Rhodanese-like protein [Verrucomicrobiales bacterium]
MDHSPGFLKIVEEAKPRVTEISLADARRLLSTNQESVLIDVREDTEWANGRAENAVHLGKGILERDIENTFSDKNKTLVMYCGGGYRSILTADVAQKMGYKNVLSLQGGYKALVAAGWKIVK